LLQPDDLLLVPHDCYGGSYRLFTHLAARGAFRLRLIDFTQADPKAVLATYKPAWIWLETPSNPLLRLTDISHWCERARGCGAKVCVDNTFLSPLGQNPLLLGADLVIHSTTKYLNGHSDVVGGAVISASAELGEQLAWWANCLGLTGAPFDAFMTLRGVRTLAVRLQQQVANATLLATFLDQHPAVRQVYYPGLEQHPQFALGQRQQQHSGAMISFAVATAAVAPLLSRLQHFSLAESLGGVESLIAHPPTMTHAAMDGEARRHAGIDDGLLRVSVGIEDICDLKDDLAQALEYAEHHCREVA